MAKQRGLPETKRMRHDAHFVDRLAERPSDAVGRQITIERVKPSPNQPRRHFDGIAELVISVQEKGILEPLLVRAMEDGTFEIIAGERRYRAALEAGLSRIPCIELDVDDRGCLEISLVENIQRRNLTPFEEADAIAQMRDRFNFKHDQIARMLGRSRTSITEILSLASIPEDIRTLCHQAGISSKSTLLQLARMADEDDMRRMLAAVRSGEVSTRDDARRMAREDGAQERGGERSGSTEHRPGGFIFKVRRPDQKFSMTIRFPQREDVPRDELIKTLQEIIKELRKQP